MISEIDIWRVATLMLKRYGDEADIESAIRAEELVEARDWAGEAIWRRVIWCDRAVRKHNASGTPALIGSTTCR
jgi:hypothetical protein